MVKYIYIFQNKFTDRQTTTQKSPHMTLELLGAPVLLLIISAAIKAPKGKQDTEETHSLNIKKQMPILAW